MDALTLDMFHRRVDEEAAKQQGENASPHLQVAENIAQALVSEGWPDTLGTLMYAMLLWAFSRLKIEQQVACYIERTPEPQMQIYERLHRMPADLPMWVNISVHGQRNGVDARLDADRDMVAFIRQRQRAYTALDIYP